MWEPWVWQLGCKYNPPAATHGSFSHSTEAKATDCSASLSKWQGTVMGMCVVSRCGAPQRSRSGLSPRDMAVLSLSPLSRRLLAWAKHKHDNQRSCVKQRGWVMGYLPTEMKREPPGCPDKWIHMCELNPQSLRLSVEHSDIGAFPLHSPSASPPTSSNLEQPRIPFAQLTASILLSLPIDKRSLSLFWNPSFGPGISLIRDSYSTTKERD